MVQFSPIHLKESKLTKKWIHSYINKDHSWAQFRGNGSNSPAHLLLYLETLWCYSYYS